MCVATKDGYKMEDGTIIPFRGIDMLHVRPEHIIELNALPATEWGNLLMKDAIHKQGNTFQNLINGLSSKLDKHNAETDNSVKKVFNSILINEEIPEYTALNNKIDGRVKTVIKKGILNAGSISKAILAILSVSSIIGLIVYYATKLGNN